MVLAGVGGIAIGVRTGAAERVAAYGVHAGDVPVYAASLGIICLVAFAACYIHRGEPRGSIPS